MVKHLPWFKFSTTFFDDDKIKLILADPQGDQIIAIWVRMVCVAFKSHIQGSFYIAEALPYKPRDLAVIFNRPLKLVEDAIETFCRLGMLEPDCNGAMQIPNFHVTYGIADIDHRRESTRMRVQKHRENIKKLGSVTRYSNKCNAIEEEVEEDKEKERDKDHEQHAPSATRSTPAIGAQPLPCIGEGGRWTIEQTHYDALVSTYPGIDVRLELCKISMWLDANPTRKKTFKRMKGFVNSWMERSQNSSRGQQSFTPNHVKRTLSQAAQEAYDLLDPKYKAMGQIS